MSDKRIARLISLQAGFWEMEEGAFVGKEYIVDWATRRVRRFFNKPSRRWFKAEIVDVVQPLREGEEMGYLPTEVLEIGEAVQ